MLWLCLVFWLENVGAVVRNLISADRERERSNIEESIIVFIKFI